MQMGYNFNSNQKKCWALATLINEIEPRSARTEYKEGKGYYVKTNEKNYYPTNVQLWEEVTQHYMEISERYKEHLIIKKRYEDTMTNIRAKLSEEEQVTLGVHPDQTRMFGKIYSKLTADEQVFVDVNFLGKYS